MARMKLKKILFFFLLSGAVFHHSLLKAEALNLTPVIFHALSGAPTPVLGSDGLYHLVYELELTNVSTLTWQVEQLQVFAGDKVVLNLSGPELKSRMGPLSTRGGSTELGPHQTTFAWLHVKFPNQKALPSEIRHVLSIQGKDKKMDLTGAKISLSKTEPMVIASPLKGGNWLAGDGCCDSVRHVRALLPINDHLYSSQRFAIDWEKLDGDHKIYSGDPKNPENYFCYGQEVFAVAPGVVVQAQDGLPNQVPGKLPEGLDINQADGNHVVMEIAPGHYALYAHMKPGSVRVKVGDQVREGQVIGLVGNSGNTSEPHLHFHLMDGPSALASNGIPYVLKSFQVLGKAPSTEAFDKAAAEGTPLSILPIKGSSSHEKQLPLDLSLIQF